MDQKKQEILDSDIATIEALHDALLDKGMDSTALMMIRSRTLTTKLHAIIEDEQESVWTEPSPGLVGCSDSGKTSLQQSLTYGFLTSM